MTYEQENNEVRGQLLVLRRWCLGLSAALGIVILAGAAVLLEHIVCALLIAKDKLVVRDTDVFNELRSLRDGGLRIRELEFHLKPIPLLPDHMFWGVTESGVASTPVATKLASDRALPDAIAQAAALAKSFGDEVLAAWIVPEAAMNETTNSQALLQTLTTNVFEKNKLVIHATRVGEQTAGKEETGHLFVKLVVIYREKKATD